MKALVVLLALGLVVPGVSAAQSAVDSSSLLVAQGDASSPVALSPVLVGESGPRPYAHRYERGGRLASWLQFIGGAMMLGASVAKLTQRRCEGTPYHDERRCKAIDAVFLGGLALEVASLGFRSRAAEKGTRALGWDNRALHD